VEGQDILEVGVGTGKNFPYYPADARITAIDLSGKMLAQARRKAEKLGIGVRLLQMDVEHLDCEDNSFDTVAGSFIFCSVPDPVRGLSEVKRVCRPGGKLVLLEHVLSANRIVAWFMNLVNPVVSRLMGPDINRKTVENIGLAGLKIENVTDLSAGIFKLIEARKATENEQSTR
jgi:ubiquinone/menaquinone biosynthesis C-methylase UbiE